MRIFKPLARAVAAETAAAITPALDGVVRSVEDMRTTLERVEVTLAGLLAVVERVEAERPGWLGAQRLSDLDRDLAAFARQNGTTHLNGIERKPR